jgi:hypothetical protein
VIVQRRFLAGYPENPENCGLGDGADEIRTRKGLSEPAAQTKYAEWKEGYHLRHSKFIGLRDDKNPQEAVRETPRIGNADHS